MKRYLRHGWIALFAVVVVGCASYSQTILKVEQSIGYGHYEIALKELQKQPGPARDRVLFLLNQGMLLQMMGQYKESNESFEAAKQLMQQLDAVSVREQTGSVTVNDGMRSYVGDPYEKVMLHVYMALNYILLGALDSARVEVKQMDLQLRRIQEKKGSYREDPMGRYLAGMIYEALGDNSNAMVSYRKAYKAYTDQFELYHVAVPQALKQDLLRISAHLGLRSENLQYQRVFAMREWTPMAEYRRQAHVFVLFHNGMAPVKQESWIQAEDYNSGKVHRIALPYYRDRANPFSGIIVSANGQSARSEVLENINAIAHKTLEEQIPGITARALVRAAAKNEMIEQGKERSDMTGLLVNMMTVASERADTRSWITLPHNIQLSRLALAPGEYELQLQVLSQNDSVLRSKTYKPVMLRAGEKLFVVYHAISPASVGGRR
jgi:hypothetical protein